MSKNILIVDDAMFMRAILKEMLTKKNFTVVGDVENGRKAVEKYKELFNTSQKVDLVLMDITMPEMDGITALKKLKEFDENVVVVMCSSLSSEKSVVQAIQSGAKHFIRKPFVEEKVINTIEAVLNKK
ncbi:two-component system response regulator [Priestia megaterium]|nr:two-component system response regulator [Priestia megaterium]